MLAIVALSSPGILAPPNVGLTSDSTLVGGTLAVAVFSNDSLLLCADRRVIAPSGEVLSETEQKILVVSTDVAVVTVGLNKVV